MNLIFFLTIGTVLISVLGEFGKYPFGAVGNSINFLDLMVAFTTSFFLIWKIAIKKELDFFYVQKWLLFFVGIGLISLFVNQNFSGSFYLIRFGLYSLFFSIGYSLIKTDQKWGDVVQICIIGIGFIAVLVGFLQLIFFPNLTSLSSYGYDPHINRLAGAFLDPNFLGAYLSMTYGVCLIKFIQNKNKYLIFLLISFTLAIILTFSRSAWLMFFIINLCAIWFLPKKIIVGIVLIGLLFFLFVPRVQQRLRGGFQVDISASERLSSWNKGIQLFRINPVFGIGFNNIRAVSIENNLLKPFTADGGNSGGGVDSSWLLIFATTGLLGGFVFIYWYFKLISQLLQKYFKYQQIEYLVLAGILIALFINSQFINSLFYPPIMVCLFLLIGVYYGLLQKE
jgi:O-antigen ligase